MKTRIVINRQNLDEDKPAIVVIDDDGVRFADEIVIHGASVITGVAMGKSPVGGARVWVETDAEVVATNCTHE